MNEFAIGYLFGSFVLAGVLPAAFILYGARNGRTWAKAVGFILLGLVLLGALGSKSLNIAHLAGAALSIAASFTKKRA